MARCACSATVAGVQAARLQLGGKLQMVLLQPLLTVLLGVVCHALPARVPQFSIDIERVRIFLYTWRATS